MPPPPPPHPPTPPHNWVTILKAVRECLRRRLFFSFGTFISHDPIARDCLETSVYGSEAFGIQLECSKKLFEFFFVNLLQPSEILNRVCVPEPNLKAALTFLKQPFLS